MILTFHFQSAFIFESRALISFNEGKMCERKYLYSIYYNVRWLFVLLQWLLLLSTYKKNDEKRFFQKIEFPIG